MSSYTASGEENISDMVKTAADNSPFAASNRKNPSLTTIIFASYLFLKLFIYKKSQSRKGAR